MGSLNNLPPVTTINDLPDHLLIHILSLLETKTAVSTSMISRKWKSLWHSVPCFRFKFLSTAMAEQEVIFIQEFLRRRTDLAIESFDITVKPTVPQHLIFECLRYANDKKAKSLTISACTLDEEQSATYPMNRPSCFANYGLQFKELTSLVLSCSPHSNIQLPGSWRLPGLKYLTLKGFQFNDESLASKVFVDCPSVEKFSLKGCSIVSEAKVEEVIIQFPELKFLKIKQWKTPVYGAHRIVVIAPKLSSFRFIGPPANVQLRDNMNRLISVRISLSYRQKAYFRSNTNRIRIVDFKRMAGKKCLKMIQELSHALSHTKSLWLSSDTVEALLAAFSVNEIRQMLKTMAPQADLTYLTFDME